MILLPPDFKDFLRLLNSEQVEYLVLGGYAVGYYGYPRATGDMDVWVATRSSNIEAVVRVLKQFGFSSSSVRRGDVHGNQPSHSHGRSSIAD